MLALHSTDGGKTWANDPSCDKARAYEPASTSHPLLPPRPDLPDLGLNPDGPQVRGQMITAMDFVGGVGYATTVNALQVSSLLKFA